MMHAINIGNMVLLYVSDHLIDFLKTMRISFALVHICLSISGFSQVMKVFPSEKIENEYFLFEVVLVSVGQMYFPEKLLVFFITQKAVNRVGRPFVQRDVGAFKSNKDFSILVDDP